MTSINPAGIMPLHNPVVPVCGPYGALASHFYATILTNLHLILCRESAGVAFARPEGRKLLSQ